MPDTSIYESSSLSREKLKSVITFGRITKVYPEERMVEVKTFGSGHDEHIPKCQWLNMDASPEGDESTVIPRRNSYCLVVYVDSEPFVLGFFTPLSGEGSAQIGEDKDPLNEGDRIVRTVGKNFIIWRSGGEIQIQSTNSCRTIYIPNNDLINTICRNYEFRTDGGTIDWVNLDDTNTLFISEHRDNINRDHIIVEERGEIGSDVMWKTQIGVPQDSGSGLKDSVDAIWQKSVKKDGATEIIIAKKTTIKVESSGQTSIDVNNGAATIVITPDGVVNITNKGNFNVTSGGKGTLKAKLYDIDGGGSLEPVHTFPSAISDFTGLPIRTPSKTVRASN